MFPLADNLHGGDVPDRGKIPFQEPRNMSTFKHYVPVIVLILAGIILFWASGRHVSDHAKLFLEGQASVCIPAGLAALGMGAWAGKNGNGHPPK